MDEDTKLIETKDEEEINPDDHLNYRIFAV
jgi:hypothetical protein